MNKENLHFHDMAGIMKIKTVFISPLHIILFFHLPLTERDGNMGQKDISLVRYFEDQERYADLINGFLFDGEQLITSQDVQEMDSRVTGVLGKLKQKFMLQKYRDSVRKVIFNTNFAIIGLENQDRVHHGMPVRIMLSDAASYDKQMRQLKRFHRTKRDLKGDEFLGGFSRQDKLHPVITICIYYGKTPYNGAKELYQMIEYDFLPDKLKPFLNNYKIHILDLHNFNNIACFKTDLQEVFGFIQRSGDAEAERQFTFEHEDIFRTLDEDAFDVITAITGSGELELVKEDYREEGGTINMCEAIRGMIEQGRVEGVKQGVEQGRFEGVKQGIEQGVSQFASLTERLLSDSRTDDLLRAANDRLYREQLFQEYRIRDIDRNQ